MWGAFLTGFANKSVELVEEKDNEIKKNMELQLKDMYASRSEAKKKAETRRDELRTAAAQLKSYGLDDTGVIKVLSSGNYDNISKLLQNEATSGTLTPQKIKSFIGEAEPNIPPSLEEFFNQATRLTAAPGTKPISTKAKTAFGFDTNAAQDVTERFLKSQNLTAEELQQSELAAMPLIATPFDYSIFADDEKKKPKGVIELEGKLSDIAATMPGATPQEKMQNAIKTEEGKELQNQIVNRNFLELRRKQETKLPEESDTLKARTTEQVRKLVNNRLLEEITPLQLKGIVYDKDIGDFIVPIPGSEEAKKFYALRQRIVKDVFENAGLMSGNRLLDRNVADAISPFAEVDYDTLTIKKFRDVAGTPSQVQVSSGAPAQPRAPAAPAAAPTPVQQTAGGISFEDALPLPLDENGRLIFSKLNAGQTYRGKSGKSVQIWNGSGWQKPGEKMPEVSARNRR
jgi:hypothetical protein